MQFFRGISFPGSFRAPLSGDVMQAFNPLNWMWRISGNQLSLLSINLGRSSDPDLEDEILDTVGSYGSQLGQIGDVLGILLRHVKLPDLSEDEQKAITALKAQLDRIEACKRRRYRR